MLHPLAACNWEEDVEDRL